MNENNDKNQYNQYKPNRDNNHIKSKKYLEDDDLVIEDNTIYEVDPDCYECLRKEKKRRLQQ
jgi:hypothetical protein